MPPFSSATIKEQTNDKKVGQGQLKLSPDIDDDVKNNALTDEENEEEGIELLLDRVDELDVRIDSLLQEMKATYDGQLLWRIPGVNNIVQAKNGGNGMGPSPAQETSQEPAKAVYSAFIYTGAHGYKLQAIAYPGGMASGNGSFVSLYIMIHSNEFDALLPWPFKQKVTLTLLEFSDVDEMPVKGKTEELVGDRDSMSFVRPTGESNPGWGFPQFMPHEEMLEKKCIKDDCLFVLIDVEPFEAMEILK